VGFDLDLVFRVAAIGIVVAFIDVVLTKARRDEFAQVITLVGIAAVFLVVAQFLAHFFQAVRSIFHL
jgi:stage III sporulation protein AC